jgi:hypothetical protein
MYDINLVWGGDLSVGSNGDLALVSGPVQTNQRVLRRLLTNSGDYIWNLGYGGGLATFVGSTANAADVEAVIRNQLGLESAIAANPAPTVLMQTVSSVGGCVTAEITYSMSSSDDLVNLDVVIT